MKNRIIDIVLTAAIVVALLLLVQYVRPGVNNPSLCGVNSSSGGCCAGIAQTQVRGENNGK
jgi:hypothetical protein